ncbi:MAG: FAD:protein FMN transferase [Clostridia bacterium]|nr:FAD:protein FMN transferase [Clostridia bacterium]
MRKLTVLLLVLLMLGGCSQNDEYVSRSVVAMDTIIDIKIIEGEQDESAIIDGCEAMISEIEGIISKTIKDSDTYIANTEIDIMLDTSPVFAELILRSLRISELTEGAFDVTVGAIKELWEKSAEEGTEPTKEQIEACLLHSGFENISIDEGCFEKRYKDLMIDLGAIGKGYAAARVCDYLTECGVDGAILSFGGNVALVGKKKNEKPFVVGVKDPNNTEDVIGYLYLEGGFVSVSGDYERYIEIGGKKYNHIIDPKTGYPVSNGIHSVSVVCDDGVLADALSTALFVMGKDRAIEFYNSGSCDFEAVIVSDEGVFVTDGLKEKFSLKE